MFLFERFIVNIESFCFIVCDADLQIIMFTTAAGAGPGSNSGRVTAETLERSSLHLYPSSSHIMKYSARI